MGAAGSRGVPLHLIKMGKGNVRLLEEGLAVYNDYGNPGQYADRTRAAAEQAMSFSSWPKSRPVGLWSACEIEALNFI